MTDPAANGDRHRKRLDRLIGDLPGYVAHVLEVTHTPGVTVAIGDLGGVAFSAGYGVADLASGEPMSRNTVMRVGSPSKMLVAACMYQLREEGHIEDLHDPVTKYLPAIRVRNPRGPCPVTLSHLATHRAGLRTDTTHMDIDTPPSLPDYLRATYARGRGVEYGGAGALWTGDVGGFQYSSLGLGTLGQVVADRNPAGLSYTDYVREMFFSPLGMDSSDVPAPGSDRPGLALRCATGYARLGSLRAESPRLYTAVYPGTAMMTTAEDQVRWLVAMLRALRSEKTAGLSRESVCEMLVPVAEGNYLGATPGLWFGHGVAMYNLGRRDFFVGHGGQYPFGFWSEERAYPYLGLAIAVCANSCDLLRFVNPALRSAVGLIAEFCARRMADNPGVTRPPVDRRWGASYAFGLLLAERVRGVLGATGIFRPEAIAQMAASGAAARGADADLWSDEAFTAGVIDLNQGVLSGASVRSFMASNACPVSRDELDLHALRAGATRARFPAPMGFFADRAEESDLDYDPFRPLM